MDAQINGKERMNGEFKQGHREEICIEVLGVLLSVSSDFAG